MLPGSPEIVIEEGLQGRETGSLLPGHSDFRKGKGAALCEALLGAKFHVRYLMKFLSDMQETDSSKSRPGPGRSTWQSWDSHQVSVNLLPVLHDRRGPR